MSFARGPQAQDKTQRAPGQSGLVGVQDDGGIEEPADSGEYSCVK